MAGDQHHHHDHNSEKEIELIKQRIKSLPIAGDVILKTIIDRASSDHQKSAESKRDSFRKSIMQSSVRDSTDSIDYEELNNGSTPRISCNQM